MKTLDEELLELWDRMTLDEKEAVIFDWDDPEERVDEAWSAVIRFGLRRLPANDTDESGPLTDLGKRMRRLHRRRKAT